MENLPIEILKKEFSTLKPHHIDTVLKLLEEGNTVPFIARYRKEMTGSMDEVQIRDIADRHEYLMNLETRKEEIMRLIDEQEKLTPELKAEIMAATKLQKLEDLYRPYKQKRRTKATIAKERGLEPFALRLLELSMDFKVEEAQAYLNPEMEIETTEQVFEGAHEIVAEIVGDQADFREWIREYTLKQGFMCAKEKDKSLDERAVYQMYYDYRQPLTKLQAYQTLAMNRGEKEGILKTDIEVDDTVVCQRLQRSILGKKEQSPSAPFVVAAIEDAYKRFIKPAIEREVRNMITEKADEAAIHIFSENLRNLLLQAPLKGKRVLGFDPAYRTGCKLAVVDVTGKLMHVAVIYPHDGGPKAKQALAKPEFKKLVEQFDIDIVAIGNGTASRESEKFVAEALKEMKTKTQFVIVNEAGASVYSASPLAREEFPDLQVEERSAVSIARRLQDPLAELVKIDPKSVGVGQYQHDVSQKSLSSTLDFVVETAVNQVGVDVNTASSALLQYVAGLTKTTAQNLVALRNEIGQFTNRKQLKKVPRLGPKTFEQAIGFLRVPNGDVILDNTGIHPESYPITLQIMKETGVKDNELGTQEARLKLEKLDMHAFASAHDIGKETLKDILDALYAPGRDLRESMDGPILRSDVLAMEDLKVGMELQGTVRNVVEFGAFVDIGVKQDGLVHISKLSKQFVKHPTDVVAVGDIVQVWVMDVDLQRQRIQLSMLGPAE